MQTNQETKLLMLGTGGAFSVKYNNNNALFTHGSFTLLVDCGVTAIRALHQLEVPLTSIDAVFITHQHADHVGGLEEFAFQMNGRYKQKPRLIVPAALQDSLWEHTLKGGLDNPHSGMTKLSDYFEVTAVAEDTPAELAPGFTIRLLPTVHVVGKPSFALLINESIYYSSDCTFDRERLIRLHEQGVRHILHECQLTGTPAVHTTLDQLLSLPEDVQHKIQLMHYGDDMEAYKGKTGGMSFIEQHRTYRYPAL
ncbi:MBL fold metallo-hydrolase [Paenibacillus senegalensis]|uniref:MBL fold metallo-hydrolase n=1 Tax=Paenibacillus senegalensis TaxID=1465766 RepID=UPI0002891E7A|nr:MBL fold metallo-hydrolase [Paenibacillus senegalensis]